MIDDSESLEPSARLAKLPPKPPAAPPTTGDVPGGGGRGSSGSGFAVPVAKLLALAVTLIVVLLVFGGRSAVLGALAGGLIPAFFIGRARAPLPSIVTVTTAFLFALASELLFGSGAVTLRLVLGVFAGVTIGVTLMTTAVLLRARSHFRGASA